MNIYYKNFEETLLNKQHVQKVYCQSKIQQRQVKSKLECLSNRLTMLSVEGKKQEKQMELHQKNVKKMKEINDFKQTINQIKNLSRFQKDQQILKSKEMVKSTRQLHQQSLKEIQDMVYQQKLMNKNQIKNQQLINEQEINKSKQNRQQQKFRLAENIKIQTQEKKRKMINFWDQRYEYFTLEKFRIAQQLDHQKDLDQQELKNLIAEEAIQIQKLEDSLSSQQKFILLPHSVRSSLE